MFARHDFNLISRRDYHLLRHVPDHFVHHEHHGNTKFFRQVERLNRQIKAFLWRVGAERDDLVVAMRSPTRLHHVRLCGEGWQARGRSAPLHIDKYARGFCHRGIADMLHHERESRARGNGEGLGSSPDRAL